VRKHIVQWSNIIFFQKLWITTANGRAWKTKSTRRFSWRFTKGVASRCITCVEKEAITYISHISYGYNQLNTIRNIISYTRYLAFQIIIYIFILYIYRHLKYQSQILQLHIISWKEKKKQNLVKKLIYYHQTSLKQST
jgi:hypothetical protein